MCGIVGAVTRKPLAPMLIASIKKLEYRGYDSAGLALVDENKTLHYLRMKGKVKELEAALDMQNLSGISGIAHTRWATHGIPSIKNAHPLVSHDEIALVHNGIIENHALLKAQLKKWGYEFKSDTDSEVVVHLIHYYFKQHNDLLQAVQMAMGDLEGAYALGIIAKSKPDQLIAVRKGSPLVIGVGKGENFIASDPLALISLTEEFIYLEDNDLASIQGDDIKIYNHTLQHVTREKHTLEINHDAIDRGEYRHFMKKEIMEQPRAIAACLEGRVFKDGVSCNIFGPEAAEIFPRIEHIYLVACGTSYHAAFIARYWLEEIAHIPCTIEIASEFRYRTLALPKNSLFVTLSQSGETADTLAALRLAKQKDFIATLGICNVPGSSIMREVDLKFLTRAGTEIGVASTKAFTTQLMALLLLALTLGKSKDHSIYQNVINLPERIDEILAVDKKIAEWAHFFIDKSSAIFLGRGALYPIALEGALKMKELSYIHAEAYPGGELKHGPLALVDYTMPVIAIVPNDDLLTKNISNLQEVCARGGQLSILTDAPEHFQDAAFQNAQIIEITSYHPMLNPLTFTIPLQLLAYHVAVLKGTDVDQPRNLAKSVTVE